MEIFFEGLSPVSCSLWEALGSVELFPSHARQQQQQLPDKAQRMNC